MSPQQFQEWIAAFDVIPSLDGWEQAAQVAASVQDAISRVIAALGGKCTPADPDSFRPRLRFETPPAESDSIAAFHQHVKSRFSK